MILWLVEKNGKEGIGIKRRRKSDLMYKTKITWYGKQTIRKIDGRNRKVWIKKSRYDFKKKRQLYSIRTVNPMKKLRKMI